MSTVGAADARFAPARMEPLHRLKILAVNVGFAELQLTQRHHGGIQIPRIERGGEAVLAVVGQRNGLVQRFEGHHRQHRPKDLLAHNLHILTDVGDNRRLKKEALFTGALAAQHHLAARRHGVRHFLLDARQRSGVNQRPHIQIALLRRIAESHAFERLG